MVSGPSAVHNMQPPVSTAEIPRDESKEQVPTVQNPSAAPSASTMQQDKSGRQRIAEFAQGTPEQSLQNASRPDPDVLLLLFLSSNFDRQLIFQEHNLFLRL